MTRGTFEIDAGTSNTPKISNSSKMFHHSLHEIQILYRMSVSSVARSLRPWSDSFFASEVTLRNSDEVRMRSTFWNE